MKFSTRDQFTAAGVIIALALTIVTIVSVIANGPESPEKVSEKPRQVCTSRCFCDAGTEER